jgi:hypothetical protein
MVGSYGHLTAISEPIVWTTCGPQHLRNLKASTAYYGDGLAPFYLLQFIKDERYSRKARLKDKIF